MELAGCQNIEKDAVQDVHFLFARRNLMMLKFFGFG